MLMSLLVDGFPIYMLIKTSSCTPQWRWSVISICQFYLNKAEQANNQTQPSGATLSWVSMWWERSGRLLMRSSRLHFYISQLSQRSGCRITNILNNENVIIVEVCSLTDRRKDWHLEASLNFWPFWGSVNLRKERKSSYWLT